MYAKIQQAVDRLEEAQEMGTPGMLFTGGKDSMLLLHLWREHFDQGGDQPPLLVIDTYNQFDEIYDFRAQIAEEWGLELDVRSNEEFLENVINNPADPRGFAGQWSEPECPECGTSLDQDGNPDLFTCSGCSFEYELWKPGQQITGGSLSGDGDSDSPSEDDPLSNWGGRTEEVKPKYGACCGTLKIDVMSEFISGGFDPLVIGRRQSDLAGTDSTLEPIEERREPIPHGRVHPLADWTNEHVDAYLRQFNVPLPSLYDEGYAHTDCVDCTMAGEEGDDWSGVSQEQQQKLQNLRDMGYM